MHTLATLLLLLAMSSTPTIPTGQPGPMQPSDYTPAALSRVVSWQLKRVPPPSPLYVSVDDKVVVVVATSQPNEVVTVNYRLLRAADGVIVPGQFTVGPLAAGTIKTQQQQIAEGFLLSVSLKAAVAITRGQTFVRVFLGAGPYGAGEPSYMLMADYVTTAMAPAHPGGRVLAPTEGPGVTVSYALPTPAAGAEFAGFGPTGNLRWRIISMRGVFAAGVAVANRLPRFVLQVGTNATFEPAAPLTITASQTGFLSAGAGASQSSDAGLVGSMTWPAAPYISAATAGIVFSSTGSIQAADQWSSGTLFVEEWLENV